MSQATPEQPGKWQAKVFLAYASEDSELAAAVQEAIVNCASHKQGGTVEVRKWPVEAKLTESILDSVQSGLRARDFGVFLYSPVDGKARDNVVFETGLCLGMKDAAHTVLLLPKGADVTPSDLRGIIGIEYPYQELANAEYSDRLDKLDGVGARIVEKIYNVMAGTSPSQEQPGAGQPRPGTGTGTGQPSAALEMFNAGWTVEAALGRLGPVEGDIYTGKFVVHAASGIGQVVGFDPPEAEPRYVEVQFGSVIGRCRTSDLFEPPIALR
jgi:hypothetical protein